MMTQIGKTSTFGSVGSHRMGHSGQDPKYILGERLGHQQRQRRRFQRKRAELRANFSVEVDTNLLTGDLDQDIEILSLCA